MPTSERRSTSAQLSKLNQLLAGLDHRARIASGAGAVAALAQAAVHHVPGTRWASVTIWQDQQLRTLAVTAPAAQEAEALQRALGQGPAVTDPHGAAAIRSPDLSRDPRWPQFSPRIRDRLGVVSLLTHRVPLSGAPETVVGLSLYSDVTDAFDDQALWETAVLAARCAGAVSAQLHRQRSEQLEHAVRSHWEIGAAIGVLMNIHHITRGQAFDLLRQASQDRNHKRTRIATEVIDTGELPRPEAASQHPRTLPRPPPGPRRTPADP